MQPLLLLVLLLLLALLPQLAALLHSRRRGVAGCVRHPAAQPQVVAIAGGLQGLWAQHMRAAEWDGWLQDCKSNKLNLGRQFNLAPHPCARRNPAWHRPLLPLSPASAAVTPE